MTTLTFFPGLSWMSPTFIVPLILSLRILPIIVKPLSHLNILILYIIVGLTTVLHTFLLFCPSLWNHSAISTSSSCTSLLALQQSCTPFPYSAHHCETTQPSQHPHPVHHCWPYNSLAHLSLIMPIIVKPLSHLSILILYIIAGLTTVLPTFPLFCPSLWNHSAISASSSCTSLLALQQSCPPFPYSAHHCETTQPSQHPHPVHHCRPYNSLAHPSRDPQADFVCQSWHPLPISPSTNYDSNH